MEPLVPLVLFVYNRPSHTKQLLNSLLENKLAKQSVLYIYSDGPKENATAEQLKRIDEVRELIRKENRFGEVHIIESDKNQGLANSVIQGVTEVVNQWGKVIVLEDDLIVSPYFLDYMNDSLNRYQNDNRVGQIGACNFFACGSRFPSAFFTPIPDSWGWATWQDRWKYFNHDAAGLLKLLKDRDLMHKFNVYGSYNMEGMLKNQIDGKVSSWAIRWQAVCVLNNWLTLYPNPSVTNHIQSQEATHAFINILPPLCFVKPVFKTVSVKEIPIVITAMKRGFSNTGDYYGNLKEEYKNSILKKLAKKVIPKVLYDNVSALKQKLK